MIRTTLAAALMAAAAAPALADVAAPSGAYAMDDSHSAVTWRIMHLGLAPYTAQLETVTGTLNFNAEDPAASTLTATIAASSVDTDYTGEKDFDSEVANFLKAGEFADITFTSTGIELTGDNTGVITGDLTFAGVTKPVSLDATLTGAIEAHPFVEGKAAMGFHATGAIKRSDFGILAGTPLDGALGDEVEIEVAAEFIQQ